MRTSEHFDPAMICYIGGKPTVKIKTLNCYESWLYDTGAAVTVISEDFFHQLRPKPTLKIADFSVTGANKKPLKILGSISLPAELLDFKGVISPLVCSTLSQPAILGMDSIRKMKIALNPLSQKVFHITKNFLTPGNT